MADLGKPRWYRVSWCLVALLLTGAFVDGFFHWRLQRRAPSVEVFEAQYAEQIEALWEAAGNANLLNTAVTAEIRDRHFQDESIFLAEVVTHSGSSVHRAVIVYSEERRWRRFVQGPRALEPEVGVRVNDQGRFVQYSDFRFLPDNVLREVVLVVRDERLEGS